MLFFLYITLSRIGSRQYCSCKKQKQNDRYLESLTLNTLHTSLDEISSLYVTLFFSSILCNIISQLIKKCNNKKKSKK